MVYLVIGLQIAVFAGFFIGLWLLYADYSFSRRAVATEGRVVEIRTTTSPATVTGMMPGISIFPVFEFTDQTGTKQRVSPAVAMPGKFRIGESRNIIFDPAHPEARVQLAGWRFYTGIGGITLMATAPMALIFGWAYIREKRRKEAKRRARNRKARERRARLKAEKDKAR